MNSPNREGPPEPNWFVAFPFAATLGPLPPPPSGFRLLAVEDLHVTIAFLGTCGEEAALRGYEALGTLPNAVTVSLGAVVPMGRPERYSALSALLASGRVEVEAQMTALRPAIADAAGARHEVRPAKAHVTIARPSRGASAVDRARGESWASALDLRSTVATLDRVALYTWSEERSVRQFRIVRERVLAPMGAKVRA